MFYFHLTPLIIYHLLTAIILRPGVFLENVRPDLFIQWPKLSGVLAWQSFADLPTPVKPLKSLGPDRAWVKCDNLSHPEYGGNKSRKLEFIIPEIKSLNVNHVVTIGGVGSNSCAAVAMMCHHLRIKCTLILFDQEPSLSVTKSLRLMSAYGAQIVHKNGSIAAGLHYYFNRFRFDPKSYFLWAGCTNEKTVFAGVNAVIELKNQIDSGLCPMPETIVVAVGSCSTFAGLTLGCALLDLPIVIKGVRVAPSYVGPMPVCTPAVVSKLMKAALQILASAYPEYRNFKLPQPIMLEQYYGQAYGIATQAGSQAMELAQTNEALLLEQTYTGKAFAAFLDELQSGDGRCMFWNTYNSQESEQIQSQADTRVLASSLQRYLR